MRVRCSKCGESEFSIEDNGWDTMRYDEGTCRMIKTLRCDSCNHVFIARMELEIKEVELD